MLKRKGFTLIELLVVVLIIGILAAIAFPQYQLAVLKARYSQLMVLTDAIRKAQDAYYLANGKYSTKFKDLDITIPDDDCMLSDAGGTIYCSKYRCFLDENSISAERIGSVYCQMFWSEHTQSLMYMIWHLADRPVRLCGINEGNELGKKVCISLGGKDYGSNGHGIYHYQL